MLGRDEFKRKLNMWEREMLGVGKMHLKMLIILHIMLLPLYIMFPIYAEDSIWQKIFILCAFLVILVFLTIIMFQLHIKKYGQVYYGLTDDDILYTKSEYYSILRYKESVKKEYEIITSIPISQLSVNRVLRLISDVSDDFVWDDVDTRKIPKPLEQIEEDKKMKFKLDCIFDDLRGYTESLKYH